MIQFEPDEPDSQAAIRGEGWSDQYILGMGVLHFSRENTYGAQHAHMGESYALELQLVHYAKQLKSLKEASGKEDGILVTCTLFQVHKYQNIYQCFTFLALKITIYCCRRQESIIQIWNH